MKSHFGFVLVRAVPGLVMGCRARVDNGMLRSMKASEFDQRPVTEVWGVSVPDLVDTIFADAQQK